MSELLVVDVAWTKPTAANLKAAGYSGAVGYLSTDASKNLTPAFVADLQAHGLAVGAVWETTATRALSNTGAGRVDAAAADKQAAALGIPTSVPIFFAVDTDTTAERVTGYFQGVQASAHPVGVYGSLRVVEGILAAGLAVVGWQTSAWSGGRVSAKAHLYQRQARTRPAVAGVPASSYDEDVVLASSLTGAGLWDPTTPAPSPEPPVQEDDDMASILLQIPGDPAIWLVNPAVGTKLHISSQEALPAFKFWKPAVQPDGTAFPTSAVYLDSLADLTSLVAAK